MKKKLLSIALGAAMVASMLAGCGNSAGTSAPAESTPAPAQTKEETPAASTEAAADTSADTAEASTEITGKIYLVSKGFQHQFWQAVLQGPMKRQQNMAWKLISRDRIPNPILRSRYRC